MISCSTHDQMKMQIFSSNAANEIFYKFQHQLNNNLHPGVLWVPFSWPLVPVGFQRFSSLELLSLGFPRLCKQPQVPFCFLLSTLDIPDAPRIVNKKFEPYSPFSPGYSWLASKVDLTGNGNSFIFLGTNLGWLIFPPIAGLVIFSGHGGVGVFLLAFGEKCLPQRQKCFFFYKLTQSNKDNSIPYLVNPDAEN